MKNFSRQREAVLNAICSTKSHPSAAWIYQKVKEQLPNISLGTVYRNLTVLEQEGFIKKIPVGDSCEHYDGDISSHGHFYCKCCDKITDIPFDSTDACSNLENQYGIKVESSTYTFVGICKKCLENKN